MTTAGRTRIPLILAFVALALFATVGQGAMPGDLDPSFSGDGMLIDWDGYASPVAVQPDGKLVVGGMSYDDGSLMVTRYDENGSRDTTFGSGSGRVTTPIASGCAATAIALQPDGKILVTGCSIDFNWGDPINYLALVRYDADGSLDTSFDGDGIVTMVVGKGYSGASSVVVQPDAKIVVGVFSDTGVVLVRYAPDGLLDTTFGSGTIPNGIVTTDGFVGGTVLLQPDGRLTIVGRYGNEFAFGVARYMPNGRIDTSFGTGGIVTTTIAGAIAFAYCGTLQPDGKVIAAGTSNFGELGAINFALIRYNSDGSLDKTFGSDGIVLTPVGPVSLIRSVAVQPDGKILAAGGTNYSGNDPQNDFAVARYNTNGSLDTSFGRGDGITTVDFGNNSPDSASGMALDTEGRAVVTGSQTLLGQNPRFAIARFLLGSAMSERTRFDFDGDGRADIAVFRPSSGDWYLDQSTAGFSARQFGSSTDRITPADYDGDGKTDIAIYRPGDGRWYILNSATSTVTYPVFGVAEDIPAPGDYDGDGKADLNVFRPSQGTWYRQNSSNGSFFGFQFGATGDVPTVGDFDGDGKNDLGIWRPSNGDWYNIRSSNGSVFGERFGQTGDKIAPADYDGDGKTDIAIFRPSTGLWVVRNSATATYSYSVFGAPTDIPISGDYDGDGKADIGVWRPSDGTWYVQRSSNGSFIVFPWGQNGDRPTPAAFGN